MIFFPQHSLFSTKEIKNLLQQTFIPAQICLQSNLVYQNGLYGGYCTLQFWRQWQNQDEPSTKCLLSIHSLTIFLLQTASPVTLFKWVLLKTMINNSTKCLTNIISQEVKKDWCIIHHLHHLQCQDAFVVMQSMVTPYKEQGIVWKVMLQSATKVSF